MMTFEARGSLITHTFNALKKKKLVSNILSSPVFIPVALYSSYEVVS